MTETTKDLAAAVKKCERLLSARERSAGELLRRLQTDGFDFELAQGLVARLQESGLVDDERFCRLYVQGKRRQGWGMRRIVYELKSYTIDAESYPELFDGFTNDDELERASEALQRYRGRSADPYAGRYRYLASKGFAPDIISQTLKANT